MKISLCFCDADEKICDICYPEWIIQIAVFKYETIFSRKMKIFKKKNYLFRKNSERVREWENTKVKINVTLFQNKEEKKKHQQKLSCHTLIQFIKKNI